MDFNELKTKMRKVALTYDYLPFDVLNALRESDLESFRVNLWRQYEKTDKIGLIDEFWGAVGAEEFKYAAIVSRFRPFEPTDIKLIRLANKDTKSKKVRDIVNTLTLCLEENLPLNTWDLIGYKDKVSEILIDAAGDKNRILVEELYDYCLGCDKGLPLFETVPFGSGSITLENFSPIVSGLRNWP